MYNITVLYIMIFPYYDIAILKYPKVSPAQRQFTTRSQAVHGRPRASSRRAAEAPQLRSSRPPVVFNGY